MSTCQKCSYPKLVLLSARRKYKCAKCSRLFFQKDVEAKEFRTWNKKQKELDIHNLKLESKRPKLTEEEKLQKRKEYYLKNKDKLKEKERLWRVRNREKIQAREREYYVKNKNKINSKRKLRWKLNNEHFNKLRNTRRNKNKSLKKLESRLNYWKQQQKALADSILKFKQEESYTDILAHSVPTFLPCEQLKS